MGPQPSERIRAAGLKLGLLAVFTFSALRAERVRRRLKRLVSIRHAAESRSSDRGLDAVGVLSLIVSSVSTLNTAGAP